MATAIGEIVEEARLATRAFVEFGAGLINPTLRLGVTGLTSAGKTVFITALVHNLLHGGRLPVFEAFTSGRISRTRLEPQPDDAVPRFEYESHLAALLEDRRWPESTRRVSELRLVIEFQSLRGRTRELTLDIVDYPGEWLLDLPLLQKSYAQWSQETLALSKQQPRVALAAQWHQHLATLHAQSDADEQSALQAAQLFTEYLRLCRDERFAMSLLPPGRFLMPGDLAGSPALTFAPLEIAGERAPLSGSLWAMMERRYESYKDVVVRPFFRDHFARLDRQIVLVDALAAINAGPTALRDLGAAILSILECFRSGRRSWLGNMFRPRSDRILFSATKADHLHHTNHDRLERILARLTEMAIQRAQYAGARIDVVALAAIRATREAMVKRGRERLPSIVGVPAANETAGTQIFDGKSEAAMFPGDLPDDPDALLGDAGSFKGLTDFASNEADYRFLRFRPPLAEITDDGRRILPHIRLDRAMEFLLGDYLE